MPDFINHKKGNPMTREKIDHYNKSGKEVIDIINDVIAAGEYEGDEAFIVGNVIKYICREKFKNGADDIEKAINYLKMIVERREKKEHIPSGNGKKYVFTVTELDKDYSEKKVETSTDPVEGSFSEAIRKEIFDELPDEVSIIEQALINTYGENDDGIKKVARYFREKLNEAYPKGYTQKEFFDFIGKSFQYGIQENVYEEILLECGIALNPDFSVKTREAYQTSASIS